MEIVPVLAAISTLFLLGIFVRLGAIVLQLQSNLKIDSAYNDDHWRQRGELLKKQDDILERLYDGALQLQTDVENINHVTNIFYKDKSPDKKAREILDEITIHNDFYDGISRAYKTPQ